MDPKHFPTQRTSNRSNRVFTFSDHLCSSNSAIQCCGNQWHSSVFGQRDHSTNLSLHIFVTEGHRLYRCKCDSQAGLVLCWGFVCFFHYFKWKDPKHALEFLTIRLQLGESTDYAIYQPRVAEEINGSFGTLYPNKPLKGVFLIFSQSCALL